MISLGAFTSRLAVSTSDLAFGSSALIAGVSSTFGSVFGSTIFATSLTGSVYVDTSDAITLDPTADETVDNFELESADISYAFEIDGVIKEVKIAGGSTVQEVANQINDANVGVGAFVSVNAAGTEATIELVSSKDFKMSGDPDDMTANPGAFAAAVLDADASATSINIDSADISTAKGAQEAVILIDAAIKTIDSQRADLGAVQNRFDNTIANLQSISENVSAARGRIQDTDFAAETANLSKNQILQQAGTAILAQAKQLPQAVLSLLQ